MGLLLLWNSSVQGTRTSDLPDLYLEWSPTTNPGAVPVWERIPLADIRSIDINRGRNRELDQFQAGRMSVVLDNRLRRYDPQAGAQSQYIDLPGTAGNYASTPDSAAVSITGDLDLVWGGTNDNWTGATNQNFLGKWHTGAGQKGYLWQLQSGLVILFTAATVGGATISHTSTVNLSTLGWANGSFHWLRTHIDVDDGAAQHVVKFFTSDQPSTTAVGDIAWVQFGATVTTAGATSVADNNQELRIGTRGEGTELWAGNVYYAEVRNGINGPVVAKFDANTVPQTGTRTPSTWVADDTGETWTVNGSAWNWGGTWGSPHAGNVKPMKRIRLRAVWDTTYDLFSGFVDSWDQNYEMTNEATTVVTATDAFKVLERGELLSSVYAEEVAVDGPIHWWKLGEKSDSTTAFDIGSIPITGAIGSDVTSGQTGLVSGDPGTATNFVEDGGVVRVINGYTDHPSQTIEFVLKIGTLPAGNWSFIVARPDNQLFAVELRTNGDIQTYVDGIANVGTIGNTTGQTYHFAVVLDGTTSSLYRDGELRSTNTLTAGGSAVGDFHIGGSLLTSTGVITMQEVALYDTALSATRILAHADAVHAPWNGDTTGERIERLLDAIGWSSVDRDIDTGESTLQSAEITGQTALAHAQLARNTEFGELFVLPNGSIRFIGRHDKWLPPYNDPLFTLSDDGSDLGYGRLKFNYDDQLIRNRVTIGYANGLDFTANSTGSQDDFLIQSYSQTGLIGDVDSEAIDYANYVLNRYDEPLLRVQGVTITPQRDPDTHFPNVLAADLVFQVNVERTPQGVGSAIDIDYTIEGVSHHIEPKFWRTELQLSPADTPGAFILDSTSQGVLDVNTLGF